MFGPSVDRHPEIKPKFQDFIEFKRQNPIQPFGKTDTKFISAGPLGMTGLKLRHAHLAQDLIVVYRVHGKNPRVFDVYAIMTHGELGIGNTANVKTQKKVAKKFQNATFDD